MTTAQVVRTSVTVNNNSPIQDLDHQDNQNQPTFEMWKLLHTQVSLLNPLYINYNQFLQASICTRTTTLDKLFKDFLAWISDIPLSRKDGWRI